MYLEIINSEIKKIGEVLEFSSVFTDDVALHLSEYYGNKLVAYFKEKKIEFENLEEDFTCSPLLYSAEFEVKYLLIFDKKHCVESVVQNVINQSSQNIKTVDFDQEKIYERITGQEMPSDNIKLVEVTLEYKHNHSVNAECVIDTCCDC